MDTINIAVNKFDLNCPICTDVLIEPLTLLCGHSFCSECLKSCCKNKIVEKCPTCNSAFKLNIQMFSTNTFIKNMLMTMPGYEERSRDYEERKKHNKLLEKYKISKLNKYICQLLIKSIDENKYIHIDNLLQNVKSMFVKSDKWNLLDNIDVGIKYKLKVMFDSGKIVIFKDIIMIHEYIVIENYIRKNINTLTCIECYYLNNPHREIKLHRCDVKYELEHFETTNFKSLNKFLIDHAQMFDLNYPKSSYSLVCDHAEFDGRSGLIPLAVNPIEETSDRIFENPPVTVREAVRAVPVQEEDSSYDYENSIEYEVEEEE